MIVHKVEDRSDIVFQHACFLLHFMTAGLLSLLQLDQITPVVNQNRTMLHREVPLRKHFEGSRSE